MPLSTEIPSLKSENHLVQNKQEWEMIILYYIRLQNDHSIIDKIVHEDYISHLGCVLITYAKWEKNMLSMISSKMVYTKVLQNILVKWILYECVDITSSHIKNLYETCNKIMLTTRLSDSGYLFNHTCYCNSNLYKWRKQKLFLFSQMHI